MPCRLLVCPNSFRGSLNAFEAAQAIAEGLHNADPGGLFEICCLPVADGGDFTADVLTGALGGRFEQIAVTDPLGREITAALGITPDGTGIVELAKASGTQLLKNHEYDPMNASTYGTGQLIRAALDLGCKKIIVGLGGSATVDGGAGLLQALGVELPDQHGKQVQPGGGHLLHIRHISAQRLDTRLKDCELIIACDVENPLLGNNGAARVFAPQKGASPQQVELLEKNLAHFAALLSLYKPGLQNPGALRYGGAAGGTSLALHVMAGAKMVAGADFLLDLLDFETQVKSCDILITAEGKLDGQTTGGKAPFAVASRAKKHGKTVIALAGQWTGQVPHSVFDAAFSILREPVSLETAILQTPDLLRTSAEQVGRLIISILSNKIY